MPIYHFHLADGVRDPDEEGIELPDNAAAQLMAVEHAGEMLKDQPEKLWEHGHWRVEVTDHANVLLFTVVTLAIDAPRPGQFGSG